jgi:hypothetical protein
MQRTASESISGTAIEGKVLTEVMKGKKVVFVPHGMKDRTNPRCVQGILTSWNERAVFVTFPISENPHACRPEDLRWVNEVASV